MLHLLSTRSEEECNRENITLCFSGFWFLLTFSYMCYFNKIQKLQKIEVKKLEKVQQIIFFLILSRVFWNCWCFTISSTTFNTNMLHRVAAALSDCLAGKGSGTRHVQERFPLPVCAFVPAVVNVRFMRTLCLVKTFFRFRFVFQVKIRISIQ